MRSWHNTRQLGLSFTTCSSWTKLRFQAHNNSSQFMKLCQSTFITWWTSSHRVINRILGVLYVKLADEWPDQYLKVTARIQQRTTFVVITVYLSSFLRFSLWLFRWLVSSFVVSHHITCTLVVLYIRCFPLLLFSRLLQIFCPSGFPWIYFFTLSFLYRPTFVVYCTSVVLHFSCSLSLSLSCSLSLFRIFVVLCFLCFARFVISYFCCFVLSFFLNLLLHTSLAVHFFI